MSKHIILGDVHLGKSISIGRPASQGRLNSRIQDQRDLLDWTLDKAIENKVTSIIVTGDVYEDPRPPPALIQFFMTWLKKCEKQNIRVDVVVGNHDIVKTGSYTVSALDIVPAVELSSVHIHKDVTTLTYDNVSFTLLPYRDRRMYDAKNPAEALSMLRKEFDPEVSKIPTDNLKITIGHLALKGALYVGDELDDLLNEIFCPLYMFEKYDYTWMGHIHKPQVMVEKPYVAHIGSMDRSDFGKGEVQNDKIIILIDSENTEEPFTEIPLPTRSLRKIELKVPEDKDTTDFIINELHALDQENPMRDSIVRIEVQLEGTEPPLADRDKISKFVYDNLGAFHICKFSESRNISVASLEKQNLFDNNITVKAAIDTYFEFVNCDNEQDRKDARSFAHECYQLLKGEESA